MSRAAWGHPQARALLSGPGSNELSIVWREGVGTTCKARLDRMTKVAGFTWVVDIKTTTDASPAAFSRDAGRYHYHIKAGHYLRGLDALAPHPRRFAFVAIEKAPPWGVAVYELDAAALDLGAQLARRYVAEYTECEASGKWPGYPGRTQTLGLPRWLYQTEAGGEE
jgi:exodeoxyribonuclease VIII